MSELRTLACAVLLSGGVAAAVSAAVLRLAPDEPPRIASVRLAELAAGGAMAAARSDAPAGDAASDIRAWALALEDALARVSTRHGVVLLPARAVAAGAPDLTGEVEAALARALGEAIPTDAAEGGR